MRDKNQTINNQISKTQTRQTILDRLHAMADAGYRSFMSKLLPGVDGIIGVRIPALRGLARGLSPAEFLALDVGAGGFYEEKLLRAFVIGGMRGEFTEILREIEAFLPSIDNWSVCDSFCASLKETNKNKEAALALIDESLLTYDEFRVRFALVMLLTYYKSPGEDVSSVGRIERLYALPEAARLGYYAKMAAAWALSVFHTTAPERVARCIADGGLDDFTRRTALRKISELSSSRE